MVVAHVAPELIGGNYSRDCLCIPFARLRPLHAFGENGEAHLHFSIVEPPLQFPPGGPPLPIFPLRNLPSICSLCGASPPIFLFEEPPFQLSLRIFLLQRTEGKNFVKLANFTICFLWSGRRKHEIVKLGSRLNILLSQIILKRGPNFTISCFLLPDH